MDAGAGPVAGAAGLHEIALLTNPTAGGGKGARYRDAALQRLRDSGLVVRNLEGRDADEAADLARASVADGVEALVLCGGDGLVHLGVQAVAGTGIPLGIIPAGTGNDVARYLDLPRKDPVAAADRVVARRTRTLDLARSGLAVLRHGDGGRLRRDRQRAGQRDAVAAGPDALQPGHRGRAAHLPARCPTRWTSTGPRDGSTPCWSRSATGRPSGAACASPRGPCSTTVCSTWSSSSRCREPSWSAPTPSSSPAPTPRSPSTSTIACAG